MSSPLGTVTKKETFEIRFGGFESLPRRKGQDFVESAEFACFGHRWSLCVYPGGSKDSDDGMVAVFLCLESEDGNIEVEVSCAVKKSKAKTAAYSDFGEHDYNFYRSRAAHNFASRATIVDALQEGALVVDVEMKRVDAAHLPFIPENPFCKNILSKFMDEESADVVFEVGSGNARFHAHRFVLQQCSSVLAELCESEGDLTPIPIRDVKPEIFRHVLYYAYGGNVGDADLRSHAKDIIDAADRFGVVTLKLTAEACYVRTTRIGTDNMMENLIYADDRNCALLKEAVMDFIVENGIDVEEKVSLEDVPSGLFADLLSAMNRGKEGSAGGGRGAKRRGEELSTMRVDALRRRLCERGLDVDGSRKAMIAALKGLSKKIPGYP